MSPLASNAHQALLMSLVLAVLALWCASAQASPVQSGNSPVEEQLSSISPADSLPSTDQADLTRNSNLFDKAMLQRSSYRWAQQVPSDELLNSIKDRIILIRPVARYPFTRKRSCFIGAGMGNNCDFKDLISASSSRRIWQSPSSPGKKRSGAEPALAQAADYYYAVPSPGQLTQSPGPIYEYIARLDESNPESQSQQAQASPVKRMQCMSGLPGGDCENSFLGGESLGQDFLRPGGRNPGRR